jgi:hypothetical protein
MHSENSRIRRHSAGWTGRLARLTIALLLTLGTAPAWAQAQPTTAPSTNPPGPGNGRNDPSRPGTERKDTQVLHPKNGDTISIRLPKQGLLYIGSLIPWAVTGGKEAGEVVIDYDVRGIRIQHIGGSESSGAKMSFTLRLVDGRTITLNVRTGNTKYKIGYAVIT